MKKYYDAKVQTQDAKDTDTRRSRNILANSGEIMESGEVRDIQHLYVMGRDGKLIHISELDKDPEKQTEDYKLNFALNHGHWDPVTGERVVDVEDIIGDGRVWLDEDGLHARLYFANTDEKADHAYAVSDNASYSTGIEWYPDGYYGAENEIDEPIGILREISMVDTGNDPRAKTIDTKADKGSKGAVTGDNQTNQGEKTMGKTTRDELTPDEAPALEKRIAEAVAEVIKDFTADVPENETEPTARDSKNDTSDTADEPKADEGSKTADKITLHKPNKTIHDRAAHQESGVTTKDWRYSSEAKRKFADMAYKNGGFRGAFVNNWMNELRSHGATTSDGITGLGLPVDTRSLFIDALEKSDGIISHFDELGGKSYLIRLLTAEDGNDAETARAGGFNKGDTKIFQKLLGTPRTVYNKMVYKILDLDSLELYENPDLIEVRARELVQALIVEVERAATIGDGRTAPASGQPDRRMFDGTRGFYSMLADAEATEGFGQLMATEITMSAGSNLYDASIEAESAIESEGRLVYITKKSVVKALRLAKKSSTNNEPLIAPGTRIEDLLDAEGVYTPAWMANASVDVIAFANKTYGLIGEKTATMRPEFKTETNQDVLLAEFPRGGSLKAYKAAVAIKFADEEDGGDTPSTQPAESASND